MRIDDSGDEVQVWMNDSEAERFERAMLDRHDSEGELVSKFGLELAMRSDEWPRVTPGDVWRAEDGEHYFIKVRGANKGEGGGQRKTRDMFLPKSVEADIYRYAKSNDIDQDEPLLGKSKRTYQRWVSNTGDYLAEQADEPDEWQHLSSHDLRRYRANEMLVEEQMNPRVVMDVGGWSSFSAIEPYLDKPSEGVIVDEFTG